VERRLGTVQWSPVCWLVLCGGRRKRRGGGGCGCAAQRQEQGTRGQSRKRRSWSWTDGKPGSARCGCMCGQRSLMDDGGGGPRVVWKADVGRRNFFTVHDVHRDAPRCQAARAQASYLVVASATSRLIREQTIEQKVCLHTPHATRPSRLVGLTRLYNLRSLTPFSDHGRLSPNIRDPSSILAAMPYRVGKFLRIIALERSVDSCCWNQVHVLVNRSFRKLT